ncbi:MAG: hypothetical protein KGV51_08450 [Moraxellaceae bacterium]|nr:hypothetical protein [Moraxellaceae bacterium]
MKQFPLLPNYFIKIGAVALLLTIIFNFCYIFELISISRNGFISLNTSFFLVSALMLSLAKVKNENEQTIKFRLYSWTIAITCTFTYLIISPFIDLIINGSFSNPIIANKMVFFLFINYFLNFLALNFNIIKLKKQQENLS